MSRSKYFIIPFLLYIFGAILQINLDNNPLLKTKLIVFGVISTILFFLIAYLPKKFIDNPLIFFVLYGINLFITVLNLFIGYKIAGTKRWIYLGNFTYQPSEFFKFIIIPLLAYLLSSQTLSQKKKLILSGFIFFIPTLLTFMQPDAGTAFILTTVSFGIIISYISTIKKKLVENLLVWGSSLLLSFLTIYSNKLIFLYLIFIFFTHKYFKTKLGIIMLAIGIILPLTINKMATLNIFKGYQQERIKTFLILTQNKSLEYRLSAQESYNFNLKQARIAIGSGGLFGKGLNNLSQTRLKFLPEYKTDFMYATISEAFGLFGVLTVIILYFILIYQILENSIPDQLDEHLIKIGTASLLIIEIIISIGSNLGIIPTKGIPLPFIAYGGTSLITHFALLGLVANLNNSQNMRL